MTSIRKTLMVALCCFIGFSAAPLIACSPNWMCYAYGPIQYQACADGAIGDYGTCNTNCDNNCPNQCGWCGNSTCYNNCVSQCQADCGLGCDSTCNSSMSNCYDQFCFLW